MDCRGYIVVRGEGADADYFYIRLLPDINDTGTYIQLEAIYTEESDAEEDADRIMAFMHNEPFEEVI